MIQQRTSARRRNRPNPLGVQFSTVDWNPAAIDVHLVRFAIFQNGTPFQDTTRDYVLNGVPKFVGSPSGGNAVSAQWNKPYLDVIFGGFPADTDSFRINANDPAFRGPLGEYLCAKFTVGVIPPPVPHDTVITGGAALAGNAEFSFDDAADTLFISGLGSIYNVTKAEAPINFATVAGGCVAYFATPPDPGDQIDFTGNVAAFLNQTGGTLADVSVVLT